MDGVSFKVVSAIIENYLPYIFLNKNFYISGPSKISNFFFDVLASTFKENGINVNYININYIGSLLDSIFFTWHNYFYNMLTFYESSDWFFVLIMLPVFFLLFFTFYLVFVYVLGYINFSFVYLLLVLFMVLMFFPFYIFLIFYSNVALFNLNYLNGLFCFNYLYFVLAIFAGILFFVWLLLDSFYFFISFNKRLEVLFNLYKQEFFSFVLNKNKKFEDTFSEFYETKGDFFYEKSFLFFKNLLPTVGSVGVNPEVVDVEDTCKKDKIFKLKDEQFKAFKLGTSTYLNQYDLIPFLFIYFNQGYIVNFFKY